MTAPSNVITRIWTIDLKTAEEFLKYEKPPEPGVKGANRKSSPEVTNRYAFEMLSGNWHFSHQGFAFTGRIGQPDADFKDGLHRAKALVQACTVGATLEGVTFPPDPGYSFEVMVTEGLDEQSWLVMDIGKGRLAHEFLASEGEVNTYVLSSAIQLSYLYDHDKPGTPYQRQHWGRSRMTPLMRKQYLDANPGLRDALYEGARVGRVMTVASASVGFYQAVQAGLDKQAIQDFMDSLTSGTGEKWVKGNPVYTLREMLLNARTGRRKLYREEQLALFIKSLTAYVTGTEVRNLSFKVRKSSTGAAPEAFPHFKN